MKEKNKEIKGTSLNDSLNSLQPNANGLIESNLPNVGEESNGNSNGKVSGNFTIVDDSESIDAIEKQSKNEIFAEVLDFFCPVKFDATVLENSLNPLVLSGILSEDSKNAAIAKAKKEFLDLHSEEITKAENLTFEEVISKLQSNEVLYKKVLEVCAVSEFPKDRYISDNNLVKIYRASQCVDKDGKNRYREICLSETVNGKRFTSYCFVENRPVTTTNVILAIRYYSTYMECAKRLFNSISEYKRILTNVSEIVTKAKENGFPKESIQSIIDTVFAD